MSNLWKLKYQFVFDEGFNNIRWPADLVLNFELEPFDFFEGTSDGGPLTVVYGVADFEIVGPIGAMRIKATDSPGPVIYDAKFETGTISVHGKKALVKARIGSLDEMSALTSWISTSFSSMLSLNLGVYTSTSNFAGSVAGVEFAAIAPANVYSALIASVVPERRVELLQKSLSTVKPNSKSYNRFATCCIYYSHALRLRSPRQVMFAPYTALPEVLLNLAKCIELLFSSATRDDLREKLKTVGYSKEQIESQLIPILIIRNEVDVGHASSGITEDHEITVLRKFVDRSVENVGSLLLAVSKKISMADDFLAPLPESGLSDRAKLVSSLNNYLSERRLEPASETQRIISAT